MMSDFFFRPTSSSTQECLKPEGAAVTAASTEPDSSSSKQLQTAATVKTEKTEVNACNINELISEIKSEQVTPPEQARNTPSPNPPPPDAGTTTNQEDVVL